MLLFFTRLKQVEDVDEAESKEKKTKKIKEVRSLQHTVACGFLGYGSAFYSDVVGKSLEIQGQRAVCSTILNWYWLQRRFGLCLLSAVSVFRNSTTITR